MSNVSWAAVAIVVMGYVVPAAVGAFFPFSYFMTVSKVFIPNVVEGEPVKMAVDRVIHRDFVGSFHVDIRQEQGGGFSSECQRDLSNIYYREGAVYPPDLDLDWWLGVPPNTPCPPLTPGRYYIVTDWITKPWWAFGGEVRASAISNAFVVTPK